MKPRILAIESSCDETAVAIYHNKIMAHVLHSQIERHRAYGGVVPELASRDHLAHIMPLVDAALQQAHCQLQDIDLFAYTQGPGLAGCLLVGATVAQGLAYAMHKPSIAIHHLEGHILSPLLTQVVEFPFLALLVSGGHTQLIAVEDVGKYTLLGDTLDDALGEAFDKTAKMLGFSYPGGAEVSAWAEKGQPVFAFPTPLMHQKNADFSFAGLKTAVLRCIENLRTSSKTPDEELSDTNKANICASFVYSITQVLHKKVLFALAQTGHTRVVVSGGVSANKQIRAALLNIKHAQIIFPSLEYCTDNAAMIAIAAHLRHQKSPMALSTSQHQQYPIHVKPRWSLY